MNAGPKRGILACYRAVFQVINNYCGDRYARSPSEHLTAWIFAMVPRVPKELNRNPDELDALSECLGSELS